MNGISVGLQPLVYNLNLTTVIKTVIFPGEQEESLVIATQVGEIFYTRNNTLELLLDISSDVIRLGTNGGYDERGLIGLAFHPDFTNNGLFYLYYSVAGSQGPGALSGRFIPDPCSPETLNLRWTDRENRYDHINTVEEWVFQHNSQPIRRRTLLNIRRPFMNHNGVNALNFSPETGHLVLTTGDGGSAYDPFNLAQNNMEIVGKIIEIYVSMDVFIDNVPVVTRFDELPQQIQQSLSVIAKGVRNITGISYHKINNYYLKYVGNVGQDMVEAIAISTKRIYPMTCFYHQDSRPGKFQGVALTGVQPYIGDGIPEIMGSCVFTNWARGESSGAPARGVLAYTWAIPDCKLKDYGIIDIDYDFGSEAAYFTCLGTNAQQTRLFLGVYGSANVTDYNQGTVYEIIRN